MKFRYKAQKADGSFYEGEREASDKFALSRELRETGETLIYANETAPRLRGMNFRISFGKVHIHDKVTFARNLGAMLAAGLSLSRALGVLERQTRNKKLRSIIADVAKNISTGASLSSSLAVFPQAFPAVMVSMVKAGEEGGTLENSLFAVSDQLDRMYLLQRKVRGALMYPTVVITVMIIIGVIMFIYIVPELTSTFKEFNVVLPLSTRIVIGTSDFLSNNLLLGIVGVAALAFGIYAAAKSPKGKRFLDFLLLRIPVISPLIRQANAARTGSTLSSLLSAGVEVVSALEITANVMGNSYYKEVLLKAREAIQKGEQISSIFRENEAIYPPFIAEMVAVGEETGKISQMLREAGGFFENEVEQKTKDLSTIIEPVLMVVVGSAVGFFAVAMISPAYSLMNSI